MVAAENDALPGAKVGGIADVVRDIPPALAIQKQKVQVVLPGYGSLSQLPSAEQVAELVVDFAEEAHIVKVYKVLAKSPVNNVTQWVIEHPMFAVGGVGQVYCDDPSDRPFARDATKFALFSAAVATAIVEQVFGQIDVIHLHDWHAALVAVLRAYDPRFSQLQSIKVVYTIHNLALQGIRPLAGDDSSLAAWFPQLTFDVSKICDPTYHHCINPMRAGINLSNKVHAVSPNYANEILKPSNPCFGFFGGEGLEHDLELAQREQRLHGILNGCEYDNVLKLDSDFNQVLRLCQLEVLQWLATKPVADSAHIVALHRLEQWLADKDKKVSTVLTSVGRITNQKVQLLAQPLTSGQSALSAMLDALAADEVFILLGSGDEKFEQFLIHVAAKHDNFLFLKGYAQSLPEHLYQLGDLFIMPSSFEPCGISQMLAMRAGQPCLVHGVGGLVDTVTHYHNGFVFAGESPMHQAENMLTCLRDALELKKHKTNQWQKIVDTATNTRFIWPNAAKQYIDKLYL